MSSDLMSADLMQIALSLLDLFATILPTTIGLALLFTVLTLFSSQACNPGKTWWRNPGLGLDICYYAILSFLGPYLRTALLLGVAGVMVKATGAADIDTYLAQGLGPVAAWPWWAQTAFYLLATDLMLYWSHRLFHGAKMWPYHAIHHSAEEINWTTAYRFHPVNLTLGSFLVTAVMVGVGVSPKIVLALAPFDLISAGFVHANLKWTLGPLKYVLATPVFHRWHHTGVTEGGEKNFAPTFSFWDVLFGTFYMPAGQLPAHYGVDDPEFPRDVLGQLMHPFRQKVAEDGEAASSATAPPVTASASAP